MRIKENQPLAWSVLAVVVVLCLLLSGGGSLKKQALTLTDRVQKGDVADCAGLADALAEMTGDAMYQLMDDWSMLVLDTRQPQCRDLTLDPVSMKQRFMSEFSQRNAEKE